MNYDEYKQEEPPEQLEYECSQCGKPMESDKTYCSKDCFKAAQL